MIAISQMTNEGHEYVTPLGVCNNHEALDISISPDIGDDDGIYHRHLIGLLVTL